MKKMILTLRYALIGLIFTALLSTFSCRKEEPQPTYEIVPIITIANASFGLTTIESIRILMHVTKNGIEEIAPFETKPPTGECPIIQISGRPFDFEPPMVLEFWGEVFFKLRGQDGYTLVTNINSEKNRTTVSLMFLVRDKELQSDRYVGIMKKAEFLTHGFPVLKWNISEFTLSGKLIDDTGSINIEDCSCIFEENKLY